MPKIYEYRGVRGLVAAPILEDSKDNFTTGTPIEIAGVAEIGKTTASSSEAHYYDNIPAVVVNSTGSDTVTITASAIPYDVLASITGQAYDESKGMFVETERTPGYWALGYITKTTSGNEVYVWRLKGSFAIPDETNSTENAGTDANGQTLTYTGISTIHKFSAIDNKSAKSVYVNTAVNVGVVEADFFASVQTPDTVEAYPSVKLDKHTASVEVSDTITLTATVYPVGTAVTWSSSDVDEASVTDGVVSGLAEGTSIITASITVGTKTYTDSCVVTVTDEEE